MKNNIFWRVYFTNQDGHVDYTDFTNKEEAINRARADYRAWGWVDEAVCVKEYSIKEIDFEK